LCRQIYDFSLLVSNTSSGYSTRGW